tara:strand:- start:788 stop:1066 length:279 start_codon:yes stop_codon:yes gene_type:complete
MKTKIEDILKEVAFETINITKGTELILNITKEFYKQELLVTWIYGGYNEWCRINQYNSENTENWKNYNENLKPRIQHQIDIEKLQTKKKHRY